MFEIGNRFDRLLQQDFKRRWVLEIRNCDANVKLTIIRAVCPQTKSSMLELPVRNKNRKLANNWLTDVVLVSLWLALNRF